MSEKFENKLFNYDILRAQVLKKVFDKSPGVVRQYNKNQLIQLEQSIYDFMGEEGWFPAGSTHLGLPQSRELFLIFSRIKHEDDSGKV